MNLKPYDVGQSQVVSSITEEYDFIDQFEKRFGKETAKATKEKENEQRTEKLIVEQGQIREKAEEERKVEMQRLD